MLSEICVLAGGLGTRMHPRTLTAPKFILPVNGRPFALWLLERLHASGFRRALLLVGHQGEAIARALGEKAAGVELVYADDGPTQLGTGGAVKRALPWLESEFLVTYGDSYLPFDYAAPLADLRAHDDALGTMSVFENRGQFDRSNTAVSENRVVRYEKGNVDSDLRYIDYGAIALRASAVSALPDGPVGLDVLQADLARQGRLRAFVATERFYEIGSEAGLADLESTLKEARS